MTWMSSLDQSYHVLNCRKHNLWWAFVDGRIDNDEKALSLKAQPVQATEQKHTLFMTNTAENHTHRGRTYLLSN